MMRMMPPRARPRRGAWWGSRRARATAAACLAAVATALAVPGPAAAFRCDEPAAAAQPASGLTSQDCRVPPDTTAGRPRPHKRGSVSSLTVLVLAIAAVLLIPIGRGIPHGGDPYGHDRFV